MWADTFLPDQALPTMLALGIRVRCPDYDATSCLVLLRCPSFFVLSLEFVFNFVP